MQSMILHSDSVVLNDPSLTGAISTVLKHYDIQLTLPTHKAHEAHFETMQAFTWTNTHRKKHAK